ncbi:MAG: pyridoxal kinase [Alphaproteobacteria bacterium]|nr:MAG: pyridoxal kinase [Alphaproteobacteria bacterium]
MSEILSVQSSVVYGRVGNSTAVFALQRLGHDAWALPTVLLSSHSGYPDFTGRRLPAEAVAELVAGLDRLGVPARVDALLTGYLGAPDTARATAALARRMRGRAGLVYLCDPVLGDEGPGLYLPDEVGEVLRAELLPLADIATPNAFELAWLTGTRPADLAQTLAAARALAAMGPRQVFVTSVSAGLPPDEIGLLAVEGERAVLVRTPRVDHAAEGAGDLASALVLAHRLAGRDLAETAERTAASMHAVIAATRAAGQRELAVVANQDFLAEPPRRFPAQPL